MKQYTRLKFFYKALSIYIFFVFVFLFLLLLLLFFFFLLSCDQQISFKPEFLTLDCYLLLLLLYYYYFFFFNRHPNLNAIQYIFVNMAISEVTDQDAFNGFQ